MYERISIKRFAARAKDGLTPNDAQGLLISCAFPGSLRAFGDDDKEELRSTWIISTGTVDREGDTINPNGWELDNFRRGGVVLFGHNRLGVARSGGLPIAKPLEVGVEQEALMLRMQHTPEETNEFGFLVWKLVRDDFLRTNSVGFLPKEWEFVDLPDGSWVLSFQHQELLEDSIVPVPANPEALVQTVGKDLDLSKLFEWHRMALDGEIPDLGVPRDQIHRSLKAMTGNGIWISAKGLAALRQALKIDEPEVSGAEQDEQGKQANASQTKKSCAAPEAAGSSDVQGEEVSHSPSSQALDVVLTTKTASGTAESTSEDGQSSDVSGTPGERSVSQDVPHQTKSSVAFAKFVEDLVFSFKNETDEDLAACAQRAARIAKQLYEELERRKSESTDQDEDAIFELAEDEDELTFDIGPLDEFKAEIANSIREQINQRLIGRVAL